MENITTPEQNKAKTLGIISTALGFAGIITMGFLPMLPALFGLGGFITGLISMSKSRKSQAPMVFPIMGVALSAISLVVGLFMLIAWSFLYLGIQTLTQDSPELFFDSLMQELVEPPYNDILDEPDSTFYIQ